MYRMVGANSHCLNEGAQLFYPTNQAEAEAVINFVNDTKVDLLIGIQNNFNGVFVNLDGEL
jgi:hypothetical protein